MKRSAYAGELYALNSNERTVQSQRRMLHAQISLGVLFFVLLFSPWLVPLSIEAQLKLVALPIALLGVLHGGADPWVARALLPGWKPSLRVAASYGFYLGLMLLVLIGWSIAPIATLIGFLAVSLWHFGRQDLDTFGFPNWPLIALVYGSMPILGPMLGHTESTAVLFGWLSMQSTDSMRAWLHQLNPPLLTLWLISFGMLTLRLATEGRFQAIRRLVLTVSIIFSAMLLLPPLIAFAAYFCVLHSMGHLLEMSESRQGPWRDWTRKQWLMRLWPATGGAVALGLIGWLILAPASTPDMLFKENLARVLFWGLAALTVPHVVLHWLWHQRSLDA